MYIQKATLCMKNIKQTKIYKEKKETKKKRKKIIIIIIAKEERNKGMKGENQ